MSRSNSDPRPAEQRPVEDDFRQRQASLAAIISSEITPRLSLLHARACPSGQELAPHSGPDDVSRFARLVLDPDASIPRRHVLNLRKRGLSPERIFAELFEPAAQRLGGMWDNDECDFLDVSSGMARLHLLLTTMECDLEARSLSDERSILMSTMPGSRHSFGFAVVEKLLTSWGWRVEAQRPESMDQILGVVSKHSFAVIGLSVSRTKELGTLSRAVAKIRRHSKNPAIGVMVGGPALSGKPEMAATVGADAMASNGLLAVVAAQKLFDTRPEVAGGTNDETHAGAISTAVNGTANARFRSEGVKIANQKALKQPTVSISARRAGDL
jgi:methanogenic corrinoid protein MtbC1